MPASKNLHRTRRRLWLDATKAQPGQIKLINKDIDRPHRIVFAQIVIYPLGKQSALTAVIANDKARHRILRPNRRRIISLMVFSQSLGHLRAWILVMRRRASGRSGAASSCAGRDWIRSVCSASGGPNEECG